MYSSFSDVSENLKNIHSINYNNNHKFIKSNITLL